MSEQFDYEDDLCKEMFYEFQSSSKEYEMRYQRETGKSPPKMNPILTRFAHREKYRKLCEERKSFGIPMKTTVTDKAEISLAPLDTLKRTKISDLRVNITAKGSYLLARTIEQPLVEDGIQTVIEDHTGEVFAFSVYHMFDPDLALRPEDILPIGTVFILKEPLLKPSSKSHIIRCDSPADIVFIDANHHLYLDVSKLSWVNAIEYTTPSTTEEWKKMGNEKFHENMFDEALKAYFIALTKTETANIEMHVILYSNISAVYLKIGGFESGLLYSRKALDLNPKHIKALYRSGRAHYELRQYMEASQCFKMALELDHKNKESADELSRCSSRLDEQKGNVDIYKLFLTRLHKPRTEIDCADFIGPVKVADVPKKGRGVVATEYVKPGTLLCVSKALCVSFDDSLQGQAISKKTGNQFSDNVKLVTKVVEKIIYNPNVFGKLISQLSANGDVMQQELFCDDKSKEEPGADIDIIRKILDTNCFGLQTMHQFETIGAALFHVPSYFNHSCLCNALWEPYNDVLVIHAVKPITCGEEICIMYYNNLDSYSKRESNISKRGFRCMCLLCELDRSEGPEIRLRREQLISSIDLCADNIQSVSVLRRLISDVERTYKESGRSQLKCGLLTMYVRLLLALLKHNQLKLYKESCEKALNAYGLCSKDLLNFIERDNPLPKHALIHPEICLTVQLLVVYYFQTGNVRVTQKWVKILLALEKLCSGGNINVVKIKYKYLRDLLASMDDL